MKIFDYEEVVMNWDSYTYPIAVGTPVSVDGVLADNAAAHGLIARTVFAKPDGIETLKVMTGGFIDMEEIVAGYGQELSSEAVQALCGIHFYKNGVCIPSGGSGGGGVTPEIMAQIENAQWKEEGTQELFSETVTTVAGNNGNSASLTYAEPITADTLKVTFDGVDYTCPKISGVGGIAYGGFGETGPDFTEFPFVISFGSASNIIYTQTAGEHTVSATAETVTTTETFKNEVNKLSNVVQLISNVTTVLEITNAMQEGKLLYFYESVADPTRPKLHIITRESTATDRYDFIPEDTGIIAVKADGLFRVLRRSNGL